MPTEILTQPSGVETLAQTCIDITVPTEIQLTGFGPASIWRDGVQIEFLDSANPTAQLTSIGNYCFVIPGGCGESSLASYEIVGAASPQGSSCEAPSYSNVCNPEDITTPIVEAITETNTLITDQTVQITTALETQTTAVESALEEQTTALQTTIEECCDQMAVAIEAQTTDITAAIEAQTTELVTTAVTIWAETQVRWDESDTAITDKQQEIIDAINACCADLQALLGGAITDILAKLEEMRVLLDSINTRTQEVIDLITETNSKLDDILAALEILVDIDAKLADILAAIEAADSNNVAELQAIQAQLADFAAAFEQCCEDLKGLLGDILAEMQAANVALGNILAELGSILAKLGDIEAQLGDLLAAIEAGNLTLSDILAALGDLNASIGDLLAELEGQTLILGDLLTELTAQGLSLDAILAALDALNIEISDQGVTLDAILAALEGQNVAFGDLLAELIDQGLSLDALVAALGDLNIEITDQGVTLDAILAELQAQGVVIGDILASSNAGNVILGDILSELTDQGATLDALLSQLQSLQAAFEQCCTDLTALLTSIDENTDGLETQLGDILAQLQSGDVILGDILSELGAILSAIQANGVILGEQKLVLDSILAAINALEDLDDTDDDVDPEYVSWTKIGCDATGAAVFGAEKRVAAIDPDGVAVETFELLYKVGFDGAIVTVMPSLAPCPVPHILAEEICYDVFNDLGELIEKVTVEKIRVMDSLVERESSEVVKIVEDVDGDAVTEYTVGDQFVPVVAPLTMAQTCCC